MLNVAMLIVMGMAMWGCSISLWRKDRRNVQSKLCMGLIGVKVMRLRGLVLRRLRWKLWSFSRWIWILFWKLLSLKIHIRRMQDCKSDHKYFHVSYKKIRWISSLSSDTAKNGKPKYQTYSQSQYNLNQNKMAITNPCLQSKLTNIVGNTYSKVHAQTN